MASTLPAAGAADTLYVVDLSGYIFRSYHAITSPLTSPTGEPTSITLGTITLLQRLISDRRPRLLAIAMDSASPTFRRDLDPNYKANRPPAPEELKIQMARCREVVEAYRLPVLQQEGFEADDLIASVVKKAREGGLKVVIVSADKDLMQLVTDEVVMWDTMRNKIYGPAEVEEKFLVPPSQLRDALALMGDTSDNVPGVPTVGPKKAAELLKAHGTIEGIYADLTKISQKKLRETLDLNRAGAFLSQQLVTLKDDLDVGPNLGVFIPGPPDTDRLRAIFTELNFTRLLASLGPAARQTALPGAAPATGAPVPPGTPAGTTPGAASTTTTGASGASGASGTPGASSASAPASADTIPIPSGTAAGSLSPEALAALGATLQPAPAGPIERRYRALLTEEDLVAYCAQIREAPVLALDTETTSVDAVRARLVGISLSIDPAEGVYIPVGHEWGPAGPKQLSIEVVRRHLGPILAGDLPPKAGHNLKYDEIVLQQAGFALGALAFDSMLASYLLDPEAQHGLKELAKRELGETMTTYDQVTSKQRGKQTPFSEVELTAATAYAGADAAFSLDLMRRLLPRLEGEGMLRLLLDLELPLARVLVAMEQQGVLVDTKVLARLGKEFDLKLKELEILAKEKAGRDFNVNSPRQLETLLFDELGLSVIKRTKTGRSTDAEVLEAISDQHELPKIILELRQIAKLKGTYIDALPDLVNPRTGRIHTSYNQAVAATGRLSSSDPNFQNIPIRTDIGKSIREAFIAPEGMTLVSADYSQIELRLLAHFSRDPGLCDAFIKGDDIHSRTAAEMFDKKVSEVTPDMRRAAKTINFGVIYGMGDAALAKRLGIPREEAARFIETYFKRYAGVKAYFDKILEEARSSGSVGTMLGRRRFMPELSSANRGVRLQAERVAQNTPIQGTAADILKLAMIALREPLVPGARMILTVHDELVFEVPIGQEKFAAERAKTAMEGVVKLTVPLLVEVGHGHNWTEAH